MRLRIEYSKAHVTARVISSQEEIKGERAGGLIELVSRPWTALLTSDIVYHRYTIEQHGDWYIKRTIIQPLTDTKFRIVCRHHSIDFSNVVKRGEILEIVIKLARARRFVNIRKIVPRAVFKVLMVRDAKTIFADNEVQVLMTELDYRVHSVDIGERELSSITLVLNDLHVGISGLFRMVSSKYRSRTVLYILGNVSLDLRRQYRYTGKSVNLCKLTVKGRSGSTPCVIIII
ncbi:MAG: hypothetical protein GXO23_02785 [Crenarchaeota archaeon]|nr:hypothetical protein [Thermoproteota archaeon]